MTPHDISPILNLKPGTIFIDSDEDTLMRIVDNSGDPIVVVCLESGLSYHADTLKMAGVSIKSVVGRLEELVTP